MKKKLVLLSVSFTLFLLLSVPLLPFFPLLSLPFCLPLPFLLPFSFPSPSTFPSPFTFPSLLFFLYFLFLSFSLPFSLSRSASPSYFKTYFCPLLLPFSSSLNSPHLIYSLIPLPPSHILPFFSLSLLSLFPNLSLFPL